MSYNFTKQSRQFTWYLNASFQHFYELFLMGCIDKDDFASYGVDVPDWLSFDTESQFQRWILNSWLYTTTTIEPPKTSRENFLIDAAVTHATEGFNDWFNDAGMDIHQEYLRCGLLGKTAVRGLAVLRKSGVDYVNEIIMFDHTWDSDWEIPFYSPSDDMWKDVMDDSRPIKSLARQLDGFDLQKVFPAGEIESFRPWFDKYKPAPNDTSFLNEETTPQPSPEVFVMSLPEKTTESGFVYFIQSNDAVKIGMTTQKNPNSRLAYYQTAHPGPISLRMVVKTDSPRQLEAELHSRFKSKRIRGEWFRVDDVDFENLKSKMNGAVQIFNNREMVMIPNL